MRATPTCALANGSCRRPPHPSSETSRTIPSRNKARWRNSPPGGWAPGLRHPLASRQPRPCLPRQHPPGPERHWRERRGLSAGDGLGNRGVIRARLPCTDREHGGTRAVSRRSGSPRDRRVPGSCGEARSEGRAGAVRKRGTHRKMFAGPSGDAIIS